MAGAPVDGVPLRSASAYVVDSEHDGSARNRAATFDISGLSPAARNRAATFDISGLSPGSRRQSWPAAFRKTSDNSCGDAPPGTDDGEDNERWKQVSQLVGVIHHHVSAKLRAHQDCLVELTDEAIQELASLWAPTSAATIAASFEQDTSEPALARAWGGSAGSWQVFGDLPAPTSLGRQLENPFNQRCLRLRPTAGSSGSRGAKLLQRCGVAAVTMKGHKEPGDQSPGQDNISVARLASGWECFCVTDGHGPDGHWVATRVAQALPFFLQQEECAAGLRGGRVADALKAAFRRAEQDLEFHGRQERIRLFISGCTATCALRRPGSTALWVAFAGDSRAALLAAGPAVVRETTDHHPSVPSELKRCLDSGCELKVYEHDDGDVEQRLFVKGKGYPGLLMTRSLGDLSVKGCGITNMPEVVEWTAEEGIFLLIASDGLWELISTAEIAQELFSSLESGMSRQKALEKLVLKAKEAWMTQVDGYCDDITALLVPLNQDLVQLGNSLTGRCAAGVCKGTCAVS